MSRQDEVKINCRNKVETFDYLFIASPYSSISDTMSLSNEEERLFSAFSYYFYKCSVIEVKGLPEFDCNYISNAACSKDKIGHVTLLVRPHRDKNIYLAYQYTNKYLNEKDLSKLLHYDINAMRAKIVKVWAQHQWEYFPHVTTDQLLDGFFDQFESLQGVNNTFYLGEALSFGLVDYTVHYSFDTVEKYFS